MENEDISSVVSFFHDFFTVDYKERINALKLSYPDQKALYVDYKKLERRDPEMADRLLKKPETVIAAAEEALSELRPYIPGGVKFEPHVRFVNVPSDALLIEHLSSSNLNELVAFKGVVTRRADVMHKVKVAVYRCAMCNSELKYIVDRGFVPPRKCDECKKVGTMRQVEEKSSFMDIQRAEVQELLERVRGGAPAAHVELLLEDELVNSIAPGDNIEITGVMRLKQPIKTRQKQELVYSRYIDANSVQSLKRDFEEIEITKEDEARIREIAKDPNITEYIMKSIAPSIYGHDEVKKALALQIFGGTKGKTMKGGAPIRDDIHILLIGDPGIAKCTDGDSEVLLADGSVKKIRDVVGEVLREKGERKVEDGVYAVSNHDILSLDLDGRVNGGKATHFWKLEAPDYMYEVETSTGKKVTVTPEHPFFISSEGYISSKRAGELEKGEFIATPRYIPVKGSPQRLPRVAKGKTNATTARLPEYLDSGFARLLGYLAGDGYLRRTTSYEISLTNNDPVLLEDFRLILSSYGLGTTVRTDKRTSAKTAFAFSVEVGKVISALCGEKKSAEKTVPDAVMRSTNEVVAEFIKAYLDCEGSVGKEGITVVSASRKLLSRIQLLLMRFGIISQLHDTYSRATNSPQHKKTKYYRLFVLGENAARYSRLIGFSSKKKSRKLSALKKRFNTNIDVIPNLKSILKETRKALGLSQFECSIPRSTYQHFERGDRNPSRKTLSKIVSAFKKSGKTNKNIRLLELLSESHVFWDKIKRINRIKPKEKWVYDLQADPTHNFIANGMIVHNTRFLLSVNELAPKSIYVSGKSVSGTGLTVAAEKDELGEGGWTLKAGAIVLASGGSVQIDEFDKIAEDDRSALHEAMETQTVSVAKAGIVAKFRAKSSVLAAANPKYGRFDQTKNLAEQFDVPPTLLSRFDLIFPIVDVLDEEKDSKLAEHILSTHRGEEVFDENEMLITDRNLLRKYVSYARRNIFPKLTKEASDKIREFYVELRSKSKDVGSVAITPRYLEGLVRMAEAHAKMRMSDVVEGEDAEVAIQLLNYVMKQVMIDRETGMLDVDVVTTGKPKSTRERMQKVDTVREIIREHLKHQDSADIEEVIKDAASYEIDEVEARRIISELLRRGELYEKEHGHVRIVR